MGSLKAVIATQYSGKNTRKPQTRNTAYVSVCLTRRVRAALATATMPSDIWLLRRRVRHDAAHQREVERRSDDDHNEQSLGDRRGVSEIEVLESDLKRPEGDRFSGGARPAAGDDVERLGDVWHLHAADQDH